MGYEVGVDNLHVAVITSETDSATVYEAPVAVPGVKSIGISTNGASATQSGDNRILDVETSRGAINVAIAAASLPADVRALLLGHAINATDKTLVEKSGDQAPYIALGFRSSKSNGKAKYVWLYKGKAMEPDETHAGKDNGSTTYKTPSINMVFIPRLDEKIKITGDEDDAGFTAAATWFSAVYEESTGA
jgi:phi13 family phage major tail protein